MAVLLTELIPVAENKIPPTERIATSFKQLAVASSDLDVVAKDLGISISNLESSVRRIGVQISAWRQVAGRQDDDGSYWSRDIGWAKINDFWCIAIRKTNGHHEHDYHNEEIWPLAMHLARWQSKAQESCLTFLKLSSRGPSKPPIS